MISDRYYFASDNSAPICPEAWDALTRANSDSIGSYGNDAFTKAAKRKIQDFFGAKCEVYFVFNGTAANALIFSAMCERYQTILAHDYAHIETDECNAPEFFGAGTKVKGVAGKNGKVDPRALQKRLEAAKEVHSSPAGALSVSQTTELGQLYTPQELKELGDLCAKHDVYFHVDGARLTNSIAALGCSPADVTWKAGVDAVSFGGTKQGLGFSEAIVIFNPELAKDFDYRQKQSGQLASKMRYLSAPWIGFLENGVWDRYARNANQMAQNAVRMLAEFNIHPVWPVQANAAFYRMPHGLHEALEKKGWHIYPFAEETVRIMTCWNTREEHIDELRRDVAEVLSRS